MFKKKILTAIISISMLCSALPAYAYEPADYHAKAAELKALIEECNELGINTQYEEIDANIIEAYADRIAEFQADGLSSSITNTQLTELDSLYTNAKANLNAYISGTKKAPNEAYTFRTGDKIKIAGESLKNRAGDAYFSAGVGHFGLSKYLEELNGYRFENVQTVVGLGDIVTGDRKVDSWDTGVQGGADVTFEMVTNNGASNNTSLHIVNKTAQAANVYGTIYQRVPVKPNTEYEFSFKVFGTNDARSSLFTWDDWSNKEYFGYNGGNWTTWTKVTRTFTTGNDEYYKGVRFIFEGKCDVYLDDITVKPTESTKNRVINGGFDGDGTDDFDIFYNEQTNLFSTIKTLDVAEKNNVRVEVLLQLQQQMPVVITEKYPEMGQSGGRYNIDHAVAQQVEKAYIEGVLNVIADYDSLGSIIVANEPDYNSSDYNYGTKFATYLEKKYGTIGALQTAYGTTKYSSFANVGIPTDYEASSRFYDWKNFNEEIFSNWYAKTVQIIKNCIPGIPVSIKAQPDVAVNDSNTKRKEHLTRGLDMERLGQLSDFNGNDSYSHYGEEDSVRSTMMWYDYLGSTSGKPIYDSEKHITEDATMGNYNDNLNKFTKQAVWESMIHGLDMYSIWTWELDVKDTGSARYGHLALRPKALSEIAKAGLDANRLGEQVTALANADPTVAILRSDASRIHNARYMSTMSVAYMAANEAGHKVGFVTNKNIESKLSDYDILIIPYATNVEANVINAIAGFNGKIVMLDSDSLKKNEYNQSYSGDMLTKVNQIKNKATVTEVSNKVFDDYKISSPSVDSLKSTLVDNTAIKVSSNGSLQSNLEWKSVPYKNGYLVSISNYDTSSTRTVNITHGSEGFAYISSLLDNEDVTSISLPKMTSGLYYVRNVEDDIFEEEEEYLGPNEILSLDATRSGTQNTLTWTAAATGLYNIYSVNPDGTLTFIDSTEEECYQDTSSAVKTYAVKCVLENGESKGKKITCGYDLNSAISVNTTQSPVNEISINYTNNEAHCIAATITATAYNSDGSFKKAVVVELLIPAGKTVKYEKILGGTGDVVITKK